MNRKCSFERKVITVAGWLTGASIIHTDQNLETQRTIRVLRKVRSYCLNFFPHIKNFILLGKKKIPKECMEIFGILMPVYLNSFPSIYEFLENSF